MKLYRYTFTAKGSTPEVAKVVAKGEVWDVDGYPDSVWDKVDACVRELIPDFQWPTRHEGMVTTGPTLYRTKKFREVAA